MLFTLRIHRLVPLGFFLLLAPACALLAGDDDDDFVPVLYEGDEPGECTDGADNDQDGLFDCNDPGCAGSPDCAGDDDDDDSTVPADDDDSTAPDDDDSTAPDDDDSTAPDDDDSTVLDDDDTTVPDDDDTTPPPASFATLRGTITTSVAPSSSGDGVGTLFVVVYEEQPFTGPSGDPVRWHEATGADFSGSGASYAYEVTDIPPRSQPYVVIAFLDDNVDAISIDPGDPLPNQGDMVHWLMPHFPTQSMAGPQEFVLDLALNDLVPAH